MGTGTKRFFLYLETTKERSVLQQQKILSNEIDIARSFMGKLTLPLYELQLVICFTIKKKTRGLMYSSISRQLNEIVQCYACWTKLTVVRSLASFALPCAPNLGPTFANKYEARNNWARALSYTLSKLATQLPCTAASIIILRSSTKTVQYLGFYFPTGILSNFFFFFLLRTSKRRR